MRLLEEVGREEYVNALTDAAPAVARRLRVAWRRRGRNCRVTASISPSLMPDRDCRCARRAALPLRRSASGAWRGSLLRIRHPAVGEPTRGGRSVRRRSPRASGGAGHEHGTWRPAVISSRQAEPPISRDPESCRRSGAPLTLGEHVLKDFSSTERLFRVSHTPRIAAARMFETGLFSAWRRPSCSPPLIGLFLGTRADLGVGRSARLSSRVDAGGVTPTTSLRAGAALRRRRTVAARPGREAGAGHRRRDRSHLEGCVSSPRSQSGRTRRESWSLPNAGVGGSGELDRDARRPWRTARSGWLPCLVHGRVHDLAVDGNDVLGLAGEPGSAPQVARVTAAFNST